MAQREEPLLQAVFNHIALPPRLPGRVDEEMEDVEMALITRILKAVDDIHIGTSRTEEKASDGGWSSLRRSLELCRAIRDGSRVLAESLSNIQRGEGVIIHVAEQNAGLLIRRELRNEIESVIVEGFEASPTAGSVLSSPNALLCEFPGVSVSVPLSQFLQPAFLENLSAFLEQATIEPIKRFAAHTRKAGVDVAECRDTADPALITQMLMTLLEAYGTRDRPAILRKRIRDDVCWEHSEQPWRRSAFWLVLRVSAQRLLCFLRGPEEGRVYYKFLQCILHSRLLQDCLGVLNIESCHFLRAKLCRRLAKLEAERSVASVESRDTYAILFGIVGPICREAIHMATEQMDRGWKFFKRTMQKQVPTLPLRASDGDLRLTLANSAPYLQQVLHLSKGYKIKPFRISYPPAGDATNKAALAPMQMFARRYFRLAETEASFHDTIRVTQSELSGSACSRLASVIETYLETVSDTYECNTVEKSLTLLNLFELWVAMDKSAIESFPLLQDYHPGCPPEALDVLQLPRLRDMERLQEAQEYLCRRCTQCLFPSLTIFADPGKDCIAVRFFQDSRHSAPLQVLKEAIESASSTARKAKERELIRESERYETLSRQISSSVCSCKRKADGTLDIRGCTHCYWRRQRRRLHINVYEDYLPSADVQKKAVLFELAIPASLAAYRDATWRILCTFGLPKSDLQSRATPPTMLLRDYEPLKRFNQGHPDRISLASTKKSFLVSHYKGFRLPVSASDVLLPMALDFAYYDIQGKRWSKDLPKPLTFGHYLGLDQSVLNLLRVQDCSKFAAESSGPSSYEIVASQTKCPPQLTVHEFTAYQSLLSGKNCRWISMLRELGSSNVNFSLEATMYLYNYLAVQAGPMQGEDTLRMIHGVFRDVAFCTQLIRQVQQHLEIISSNWRESYCMEMLLTLILRLCDLGAGESADNALTLLLQVRQTTLRWIHELREELHNSVDAEATVRLSRYSFLAALLCKRTFSVHADYCSIWAPEEVQCFVEASIALQESLNTDPASLPPLDRSLLIRDLKMTFHMRNVLRSSVQAHLHSLESAIHHSWPEAEGCVRTYGSWRFSEWWVVSTVEATDMTASQVVHYHVLEGHLLINNKPLGRLPQGLRESEIVTELFEHQHLLTFPSPLPGMTYMLASRWGGHQIHLGLRNGRPVIQARIQGCLLEYVDRSIFGTGEESDLPSPLIHDCVHWLNLNTGQLEFRKRPKIWKHNRLGNWFLDVRTRRAWRRQVFLVDPHSALFRRIAGIFRYFEDAERLTVYQPSQNNLTVELKRMDLEFRVNRKGLLQSKQLRSEIDPDQDAGTWYGLESKIVLRDARNHLQRSVIVPIGPLKYHRHGPHVAVRVMNDGRYGRYHIDKVLGRLHCATEPLLMYTKAQLHAFTSFVLPDPLTGRSGTEEALACFASGSSQPWTFSSPHQLQPLVNVARLTPKRQYYPKGLRRQQIVSWNPELTVTIQHDHFRTVVETILGELQKLAVFSATSDIRLPELDLDDEPHLRKRSYTRRRRYERPDSFPCEWIDNEDQVYEARDRVKRSAATDRVSEVVHLLRLQPSSIHTTHGLIQLLQKEPFIKGYGQTFSKPILSDLLATNISLEWGAIVNLCRRTGKEDRDGLIFKLGAIAFTTDKVSMGLLRSAAAFSSLCDLQTLDLPPHPSYDNFQYNQEPTIEILTDLIRPCCRPYASDIPSVRQRWNTADQETKEYEARCELECRALAANLLEQWPCSEPTVGDFSGTRVDIEEALDSIRPAWIRLFRNWEFSRHLAEVQRILAHHTTKSNFISPVMAQTNWSYWPVPNQKRDAVSLPDDLLQKNGPSLASRSQTSFVDTTIQSQKMKKLSVRSTCASEIQELKYIVNPMTRSQDLLRRQYGEDLMDSVTALEKRHDMEKLSQWLPLSDLEGRIAGAQKVVMDRFQAITDAFIAGESQHFWLRIGNLWPCITTVTLLEQLRTTARRRFGAQMKEAIIKYAESITQLQYLMRVFDAQRKQDSRRLQEELQNPGHGNWKVQDYPDWILLEIDANIYIRDDQVDVARATISPPSGSNSVLQMNMGQGKTSVIMPMVACALANQKNLARVIVPKALLLQTAQTLQSRIGGLVGREIRHIPFSRKSSTAPSTVEIYRALHETILERSGILLTLPEHVLSFMLSGLQSLSETRLKSARAMIKTQAWINSVARDMLDESDFTLATKTQLIYPSGAQLALDGHPHRWKVPQVLLSLIESHLDGLVKEFPRSLEVVQRPSGGFPFIHFLRPDAENALHQRLVNDICAGRTSILPPVPKDDQNAIRTFLSHAQADTVVTKRALGAFDGHLVATKNLFLLRGLLVHGILLLCLKKRWNVQYGLHPQRDPIAVPFHAKGVPSDQAEWGHPDVAILFTCLSFYYNGLTIPQLRQTLQHLLRADDPAGEYDRWTHHSATLPEHLRHWNVINIEDEGQIKEIWHHLRFVVIVINDFLNHFVFPVHAKQFCQKLQASGWDIPLFTPSRENSSGDAAQESSPRRQLTTGFSGTNDNRRMLPLTIRQRDLPGLSHTNAEVLTYLLQPRNRSYMVAAHPDGRRLSEVEFLCRLRDMDIRLLIDAGAHILELDNKGLVRQWLEVAHEAPAAVYFDENNKAWVLYRNGKDVPLLASPFVENLEDCLVYLDEAHTRGTDLKFPENARGALTLSLGQTKDHTVQAAMRLRLLRTTQSVVFVAQPEVHQSLLDHRQKAPEEKIDSSDVVGWLFEQTCRNNDQMRHLYLAQGFDFCRRKHAGSRYTNFLTDSQHRAAYLATLMQSERQTLDQLYAPTSENQYGITEFDGSGALRDFWEALKEHAESLKNTNDTDLRGSAFEEVEQEREVASQVEEVRQVQRPVHFKALTFPGLHPAILHFAKTGKPLLGSSGYKPAFSALQQTTLGRKHQIGPVKGSNLYVSEEYTRTILRGGSIWHDDFLRPVHWVLWSPKNQTAIVIIPEEADELAPVIRDLEQPGAHLLVYAAPVTKRMLHFNKLAFYCLPSVRGKTKPSKSLILELGILAGRLYFEFDEYGQILKYLDRDHAGVSEAKDQLGGTTLPAKNLTSFLEEWFTVTRKGQDFEHTPMGYVCHGLRLWQHHPFFTTRQGGYDSLGKGSNKVSTWLHHNANGHAMSDSENEGSIASEPEFDDIRGEDMYNGEMPNGHDNGGL